MVHEKTKGIKDNTEVAKNAVEFGDKTLLSSLQKHQYNKE